MDTPEIWETIKEEFPAVANELREEYRRTGGFIPHEKGFVYVIHACGTDFYKIGKTVNPDRRILEIAPRMPFPTKYARVWRSNFMSMAERFLHSYFDYYRTNGEWFKLSGSELDELLNGSPERGISGVVRNTYPYILLDELSDSKDFLFWLEDTTDGLVHPWNNPSSCIAWIEEIFQIIEHENSPLPIDIQQVIDNYQEDRHKRHALFAGDSTTFDDIPF